MSKQDYKRALEKTKLLRAPKQKIATFFSTEIDYAVVSKLSEEECCLREGTIICAKPKIIHPKAFMEDFSGFSKDAVRFADFLSSMSKKELSRLRMLGYQFKNKLKSKVVHKLSEEELLENLKINFSPNNGNTTIIAAPDDIWSLSLVKIIFEVIAKSVLNNIEDFEDRGFFLSLKERQKNEIEDLFSAALHDKGKINHLGDQLQKFNLFQHFEDRFFRLVDFHK